MNMNPLVSIVVPAYNHADYLKECIESVLSQTWDAIELIVLDDGSTDATREILAAYGERFIWQSHANMGQSATLTKGWAIARGSILGYLSADDVLHPDAVTEAVKVFMARTDVVATYSDFNLIDNNSKTVRIVASLDFEAEHLMVDLVCQPGPGAFFRRDAYLQAGPWDSSLQQNPDLDFWLRLALYGTFCRIPKVLAGFRVHAGSTTYQAANISRSDEPIIISNKLVRHPRFLESMYQNRSRVLATGYIASAQLHLRAGRVIYTLKRIFWAFEISPTTVFSKRSLHLLGSAIGGRFLHRIRSIFVKLRD